jgi:DNA polymerase sliding clamp subunit (PCNA homolog)
MGGVFFELGNNNITFVATDAHRLVRCIKTDVKCGREDSYIVPKKPLGLLKNMLSSLSDEIRLSNDQNHLVVKGSQFELYCRLIDAKFPDYRVVIPANNPYKLVVNRNDFLSALKRIDVFSNKTTHLVTFEIQGNSLHLNARDEDSANEGHEHMPCQYEGEDMMIAFNAKLLLELINALEVEELLIELSTPSKAGIIRPAAQSENEDLLILMMPLMIS